MRYVIDLARAGAGLSLSTRPDEWPAPGNAATTSEVIPEMMWPGQTYWRRTGDLLEIASTLQEICAAPRRAEADVVALVAMALGAPCLPGRTHLRQVGRIPPAATARFGQDGTLLSSSPSSLAKLAGEKPGEKPDGEASAQVAGRLCAALRSMPEWRASGGAVVAHGVGLGSQFLIDHRPPPDTAEARCVTVEEFPALGLFGEPATARRVRSRAGRARLGDTLTQRLPATWPAQWSRHLPAAVAVAAAADARVDLVITGHGMRQLLAASPAELAAVRPGRWTGEPPAADGHPSPEGKRPPYRRGRPAATSPKTSAGGDDGPSTWLTGDGVEQVRAVATAGQIAWANWTKGVDAQVAGLLRAWADPGLAWLRETARHLGVRLVIPAWKPEMLAAALPLAPSARIRVEHGLITDGPLLRSPSAPAAHTAGGEYRCRKAAVRWAASPDGARSLDHLARGCLVDDGLLDGARIREVAAEPFTRTHHALVLRRLCDIDSWLVGLE